MPAHILDEPEDPPGKPTPSKAVVDEKSSVAVDVKSSVAVDEKSSVAVAKEQASKLAESVSQKLGQDGDASARGLGLITKLVLGSLIVAACFVWIRMHIPRRAGFAGRHGAVHRGGLV